MKVTRCACSGVTLPSFAKERNTWPDVDFVLLPCSFVNERKGRYGCLQFGQRMQRGVTKRAALLAFQVLTSGVASNETLEDTTQRGSEPFVFGTRKTKVTKVMKGVRIERKP